MNERLAKIETALEWLRLEQERSSTELMRRLDELDTHWSQRCDLRHVDSRADRSYRIARISAIAAIFGIIISSSISISTYIRAEAARATYVQPTSK